jgi:hypothetical protein
MNKLFPQKYSRVPGYIELPLPSTNQKAGRCIDRDSGQTSGNSFIILSKFRVKIFRQFQKVAAGVKTRKPLLLLQGCLSKEESPQ